MAPKLKVITCSLLVLFVVLLLLDLATFGVLIGVAVRGIDEANNDNSCSAEANSSVECVLIIDLLTPEGMDVVTGTRSRGEIKGANDVYLYWMAGATGCGVVWAIVNTLALIVLSELIRALYKVEEKRHRPTRVAQGAEGEDSKEEIELNPRTSSVSSTQEREQSSSDQVDFARGPDNIELTEDTIGSYQEHEWLKKRLRHFNLFSVIGLFLSSLSYACALLCLLWGIAISFDHTRRATKSVTAFITVEILTAVLLPVFLFVGTILLAIVLDFITVGHLDLRIIIPRFVRDVRLESGEKKDYWVVDDTIYYPLKKKEDRMEHRFCCYSIDTAPATWFLTIIVCTGFHLAISIFVDMTLDRQITVDSCNNGLIDRTFDCFNASTLRFVDCVDNTQTSLLHCFKFFRFGVETDFVSAISASYFIFLLTMAIFSHIYFVVRNLLRIKPSRFWGIGFVLAGIICYISSIVVTVFWIVGYAADSIAELQQINIIHIAQFFMVSNFFTTVGMFLLVGKWYERVLTKVHAEPIKIPLISYNDTERKYIHEVAAQDTWPGHTDD